jgi:hypothetical protein
VAQKVIACSEPQGGDHGTLEGQRNTDLLRRKVFLRTGGSVATDTPKLRGKLDVARNNFQTVAAAIPVQLGAEIDHDLVSGGVDEDRTERRGPAGGRTAVEVEEPHHRQTEHHAGIGRVAEDRQKDGTTGELIFRSDQIFGDRLGIDLSLLSEDRPSNTNDQQ